MHLFPWASAALMLAFTAAATGEQGIVQVDLAFPRNETYAPSEHLPLVFAFQNPTPATYLNTDIEVDIMPYNDSDWVNGTHLHSYRFDMRWLNYSSDGPLFESRGFDMSSEGVWLLLWRLSWSNCSINSDISTQDPVFGDNSMANRIVFTTKNSAPSLDLVTATKNAKCSNESGIALNVTNNLDVPIGSNHGGGDKCAVLAQSEPAPSLCPPAIDSAAASKVSAALASQQCQATSPVVGCGSDDHKGTAEKLAVGAVASLAAGIGALSFLLF